MKKIFGLILIMALVAGCGQTGIMVDKTGMTPEQTKLYTWKENYANALDFYESQLKSYKITLEAMTPEQRVSVKDLFTPTFKYMDTALKGMKIAVDSMDTDAAADAYDNYLILKAQLLALIASHLSK